LAIAEHLLGRERQFRVRLLTGSPVISDWSLPAGLDVTALPPVVKTGVETYRPRNSQLPFGLIKAYREALILKAVIAEAPDVLLVDHAPAGMNAELLATLAFIRREMPSTHVVLGLRDILDAPQTVREIWSEQAIIPLIENLYDQIIVYGCRALFDVVAAYGLPATLAAKLRYSGYVARPSLPARVRPRSGPRTIVVTAGGGEDGFFLMEAYLDALTRLSPGAVRSKIVTGPLMSAAQRQRLDARARASDAIEIITVTTDLPTLLDEADLIVSMGGYNTSVEIIGSGKPAILVPRAAPRAEQKLRADLLARLGYVWTVAPGDDLAGRLAAQIAEFLGGARLVPGSKRLDLDGARRVGDLLETMVCGARQNLEAAQ
jgi:predicted glycosyltransferase